MDFAFKRIKFIGEYSAIVIKQMERVTYSSGLKEEIMLGWI